MSSAQTRAALQPLWTASLPGNSLWLGRPAVDGGRVFVQAGNQLVGLDAETGTVRWSRAVRVAPNPPPTTLLARDGAVYVSEADSVLAVDGASGRTVWAFHPDSQAVVAPALDEAALYTGQRGVPVVYALDRAGGALRWRTNLADGQPAGTYRYGAQVYGVGVSGDTVYAAAVRQRGASFGLTEGVLVALDRRDGRVLWRYGTGEAENHGFTTSPAVAGGLVIVGDYHGDAIVAYDPAAGRVAWRAPVALTSTVTPTIADGVVLAGSRDGYAYALDARTGAQRWRVGRYTAAFGGAVCGGAFYLNDERIRKLDPTTGRLVGETSAGAFAPFTSDVASDGRRIYFTGTGGTYALPCG